MKTLSWTTALSWAAALALFVNCTSTAAARGPQQQKQAEGPREAESNRNIRATAPAKAWLGVQLAADDGGARIVEVIRGTPAATAGIMVDDYIVQVGTEPVHMPADVISRVNRMSVGDLIRLRVRRKRAVFDTSLRLTQAVSAAELLHRRLVGQPAPDFDLPVVHGSDATSLAVSGFRGRVVLLEFWATWCENCGEVHPLLNNALARAKDLDGELAVLSMAAEPRDQINGYLRRHTLNYPVLFDQHGEVRDRYHAPSLPTLVVIDRTGIVRFARAGAGKNVQAAIASAQRLSRGEDKQSLY